MTIHPAPPATILCWGVVCHRLYGWTWLGELGQLHFWAQREPCGRWETRIARKSERAEDTLADELAVGTGASLQQAMDDAEERLRQRGEAIQEARDAIELGRRDLFAHYPDPTV